TEHYSFDVNGNRTISGYVTGVGNQLLSDGTYNYTYDQNGNTLTKTRIADVFTLPASGDRLRVRPPQIIRPRRPARLPAERQTSPQPRRLAQSVAQKQGV